MTTYSRPSCQNNNCKNVAHFVGYRKDGTRAYRRRKLEDGSKIYVCGSCHQKYYRKKTGADWAYGSREGESRAYIKHRKSYCENIDGRLGHVCTATIHHERQLTVDHVMENFSKHNKNSKDDKNKNDLSNLQTLCHNCHNWKNFLVASCDRTLLKVMVEKHLDTIGESFTKTKLTRRVNRMLINAGKYGISFLLFSSIVFLPSCGSIDSDNIKDRISGEIIREPNTPEINEIKINYKVWRW